MTARARPESRDGGQAAALMVVMLLVLTVAVAATVEIGRFLDESARARTAADAAALAGAAAGRAESAALAAANGGVLLSYAEQEADGGADALIVTVAVQVGRARQTARAERLVEWTAPPDATHN
ncbi:MAG: hypothetical protein F4046_09420 [Acidimicrobiaceae bacterium]|nr:hypothetical protein [Acidimicrobiaceae bacterium]